ncbi:MAG: hypothetical protein ACI4WY_13035 [Anaerovoracaceae bacterium]
MAEEIVVGKSREKKEDYDLITLVMICLGNPENTQVDILQMLDVLLSGKIQPIQKKQILESKFGIPMTRKMEGEAEKMCNFSDAIEENALERGRQEAVKNMADAIRNLMRNMNLSIEAAMDALGLPMEDRPEYRKLIEN